MDELTHGERVYICDVRLLHWEDGVNYRNNSLTEKIIVQKPLQNLLADNANLYKPRRLLLQCNSGGHIPHMHPEISGVN